MDIPDCPSPPLAARRKNQSFPPPLRAEKSVSVPRRHRFLSPPRLPPEGWKFFNAGRFRKNRKSLLSTSSRLSGLSRIVRVSFHAAKKVSSLFHGQLRNYQLHTELPRASGIGPDEEDMRSSSAPSRPPLSFQPPACLSTETEKACRRSNARKCPPKPWNLCFLPGGNRTPRISAVCSLAKPRLNLALRDSARVFRLYLRKTLRRVRVNSSARPDTFTSVIVRGFQQSLLLTAALRTKFAPHKTSAGAGNFKRHSTQWTDFYRHRLHFRLFTFSSVSRFFSHQLDAGFCTFRRAAFPAGFRLKLTPADYAFLCHFPPFVF